MRSFVVCLPFHLESSLGYVCSMNIALPGHLCIIFESVMHLSKNLKDRNSEPFPHWTEARSFEGKCFLSCLLLLFRSDDGLPIRYFLDVRYQPMTTT